MRVQEGGVWGLDITGQAKYKRRIVFSYGVECLSEWASIALDRWRQGREGRMLIATRGLLIRDIFSPSTHRWCILTCK